MCFGRPLTICSGGSVFLRSARCLLSRSFSRYLSALTSAQRSSDAKRGLLTTRYRRTAIASGTALAYSLRAGIFVYGFHEVLVPDTREFSSCSAGWSSPSAAATGCIAGYPGLQVYGVVGAAILGFAVGWYGCSLLRAAVLALSPPGWYAIQAATDAFGAGVGVVAYHKRRAVALGLYIAVGLLHLESLLCYLPALALRRYTRLPEWIVACSVVIAGVGACIAQWHIQVRYLLPGVALAVTTMPRLVHTEGLAASRGAGKIPA